MSPLILLFLLFSLSVSISCGEYTTTCRSAGPIYVQYSYVISVNSNGVAKKIVQFERQYTDSSCKKGHYLTFQTTYSPIPSTSLEEGYDLTYKSVTLTVEDLSIFTSLGFSCSNKVKKGKPFSLTDNSCEQAKLPYTTLYQESIGTTIEDVQFTVLDNVIRVMGMDASYSGIDGCATKIALIVIISVVAVIIILLVAIVCCIKRKN